MLEQPGDELQRFWSRFAASLKQGQSRIFCAGKSLAVKGGLRLHELEGRTEVTPSWRLEVIGSYGRTVVEERHGARSAR